MAIFTGTQDVSGIPQAQTVDKTPIGVVLAPDDQVISLATSQQTRLVKDTGPTAALEQQLVHRMG
jgi:hypothetical protein